MQGSLSQPGVQEVESKSFGFHGSPGCHSPELRLAGSWGPVEMETEHPLGGLQLWEVAPLARPPIQRAHSGALPEERRLW